jgi:dTDP-4-amino-4,6-dideoxygalactose transaminase
MRKQIPFLSLKEQYQEIKTEVLDVVAKVFDDTAFSAGNYVSEFEKNFSKICAVENVVAVNNGTSAIHLCMLALGIKQDDEVIVPANTFIASAWGACYVNAKPVFVDCDPQTWNIDASKIEEKITAKTKAVVGVHLYGQPFDIDAVKAIAEKHKLFLVEDCAQSHLAKYKGKLVGSFGDISAFSFYPGKNLGAYGEAGAVVSKNKQLIDAIRVLINQGSEKKYYHNVIGYNMRMDGVQGAILNLKLNYIKAWTKRRNAIAKMYQQGIKNTLITMQHLPENYESAYHLFVITNENRDHLMEYLNANGIAPGIHYPVPIHLQKAFSYLNYKKNDFPNSEYLSEHCLSLPMYPELTDEEVNYVIEKVNNFS